MDKQITVIYSPLCRAHEHTHYFQQALEMGYGLQEISVLHLEQHWEQLDGWVREILERMRREGGFLAAPLVFLEGKAVPAWKLNDLIKGDEHP